jgi:hypothetical protein
MEHYNQQGIVGDELETRRFELSNTKERDYRKKAKENEYCSR